MTANQEMTTTTRVRLGVVDKLKVYVGLAKFVPQGTDRENRLAKVLWDMSAVAILVQFFFLLQAALSANYLTAGSRYYLPIFLAYLIILRWLILDGAYRLVIVGVVIGLGFLYGSIALYAQTAFHIQVMLLCMGITIATMAGGGRLGLVTLLLYGLEMLICAISFDGSLIEWYGYKVPQQKAFVAVCMLVSFYLVAEVLRKYLIEHETVALAERDKALASLTEANQRLETLLATTETKLGTSMKEAKHFRKEKDRLLRIDQMLAGLAHGLGSPLGTTKQMVVNMLKWTSKMPKWENLSQAERQLLLERIDDAGLMVERNVDDALKLMSTLGEIGTGQFQDQLVSISVKRIVDHAFANLRGSGHVVKSKLITDFSQHTQIVTYRETLEMVLRKIIMNAEIHAFKNKDSGTIAIRCRDFPDMGICRIEVTDDGWGMSSEVLERAFDPFYTTHRSSGSLGMGLTIANHQTKAILAGTMRVRSAAGEGTTFKIDLPLRAPSIEPQELGDSTQPIPMS